MHIQFAGYDIECNSRIYNFDVVETHPGRHANSQWQLSPRRLIGAP